MNYPPILINIEQLSIKVRAFNSSDLGAHLFCLRNDNRILISERYNSILITTNISASVQLMYSGPPPPSVLCFV